MDGIVICPDDKNPRRLLKSFSIGGQRKLLLLPLRGALADFVSARSPGSAQTVFHRVIRVKEWGLGRRVHGHSVSSRFSAEAQCVPHGLGHSAKVQKQLCEDYQSPITANVTASAPLNVIISTGKHIEGVYGLREKPTAGRTQLLLLAAAKREIKG